MATPPPAPPLAGAPPGPDHRDLYLLVVGIVLGVLLGPAVLGRISPSWYERLSGGVRVQAAQRELEDATRQAMELRERMSGTGVTPEALSELDREQGQRLARLQAALEAARGQRSGRATALVLAAVALMVVETLLPHDARGARRRVAMARYALLALWLALLLAQPALLRSLPVAFAGGVIAVALLAALVPLPARRGGAEAKA